MQLVSGGKRNEPREKRRMFKGEADGGSCTGGGGRRTPGVCLTAEEKDEPSFLSRCRRRSTLLSFLPPSSWLCRVWGEGRTNLVLMPPLSGGEGGGAVVGQPERVVNTAFAQHLKSILQPQASFPSHPLFPEPFFLFRLLLRLPLRNVSAAL